jgi:hypothetical protein
MGKFPSSLSQPINFCRFFSLRFVLGLPDVIRRENQFLWRLKVVFVTKRWKTITLSIFYVLQLQIHSLVLSWKIDILPWNFYTFLYVCKKKIIFPPFRKNRFSRNIQRERSEEKKMFKFSSIIHFYWKNISFFSIFFRVSSILLYTVEISFLDFTNVSMIFMTGKNFSQWKHNYADY